MKAKTLQFGKAMSAALFVLLLSVAGMKNAFAQTQTATLQHAGNISAFTGPDAFAEAHAAAEDGDTITLSSGNFNSCNITKAITLHGAGIVPDTLGITPTRISGNFDISNTNDSLFLIVEGIDFSFNYIWYRQAINRAKFIRCHFNGYGFNSDSHLFDVQFINCLINTDYFGVRSSSNSVMLINCMIRGLHNMGNSTLVFNSIINMHGYNSSSNLHLYNCIVGNANQIYGTRAYNCIQVGSVFGAVETTDCLAVDSYSDVFENWEGNYTVDADYSLKEEIASGFLGNDGTEVGIYGGMMPYNPRPSYLISYRCTVASRTTVDGKLSVDVEVVTGD